MMSRIEQGCLQDRFPKELPAAAGYGEQIMKNRTKQFGIVITSILAFGIILTLTMHLMGVKAQGSVDAVASDTKIEHAGTEVEDYYFTVIEDEELPAAAAPVESKASKALWVMTVVLVMVLLIGYELWYEATQARIKALSVGDREEADILHGVNRLHPFRAMNAKREMEIKAAEEYFK